MTSAGLAGVEKLPNLKKLDVTGTVVDDAGLAHIGKSATLEELHLSRTKVTAHGLSQLPNLKTLGKLVLEGLAGRPRRVGGDRQYPVAAHAAREPLGPDGRGLPVRRQIS